ncbi:MAG: terpene cyclase/mutase family protein [Planctomycetes bacterium]|nr:terpene cyclase/mutase family protein [Planctomycetota bacterium]
MSLRIPRGLSPARLARAVLALAVVVPAPSLLPRVFAEDAQPPTAGARLDAAFAKGAAWLAAQQKEGGAWNDQQGKPDVGITGLVVASIAGGPAALRAPHQAAIDKGCAYLLSCQQLNGGIHDPGKIPALSNYKTCIAIMALTAADREKYKDAILKARASLEGNQFCEKYHGIQPDDSAYGGWEYDEHSPGKPGPDLSNVSFTVEALKEAGLPADSEIWKRAVKFLERCQNRSESNDRKELLAAKGLAVGNDGGFTYDPTQSKAGEAVGADGKKALASYGSMTYSGIKSFIYAGVDKKDPRVQAAYGWIQQHFTLEENPGLRTDADPQSGRRGWFYYFHTFAKALDAWGEKELVTEDGVKHLWADELAVKLAALQSPEGWWQNENPKWWEDYRPLVTSYSLLSMARCAKWTSR